MKAAVSRSFGPPDVVTVADVPRPEPRGDEILVRVRAAAVGVVDGLARRGSPWYARAHFGLLRPRFPVLGCDFAGQVEAAGPAVSRFGVGEAVFGTIAPRFGAHAEYICLPERGAVARKPATVSYVEAAALADATALCFLRDKAGLRAGQAVLVNGASGAVGSAAVQLSVHFSVHFGASVTGVCSGPHLRLVRKLGAESVIDYTRTDFTRAGRRYDVIFDVAGTSSFGRCRRALNPGGVYLTTAPFPRDLRADAVDGAFRFPAGGGRVHRAAASFGEAEGPAGHPGARRGVGAGSRGRRVLSAGRIADAYRHVDAGHKKGTIVVTLS
jgi:NADPH:quinone reductase-like Zn-dependent oxidoreductase